MNPDRIAVIDLGSNTFHLLICETYDHSTWVEIHKEREYVKLASSGIDTIDEASEQRAIDAMKRFLNLIQQHEVSRIRAIGTAALRESANGVAIANKLESITGIPIEIIDGQLEAHYILLGIQSALPALDEYSLIMDIGGGSVEFILFKGNDIAFSESFRIGVAVLYREFHHADPISTSEIAAVEKHLSETLQMLFEKLKNVSDYYLIGASGSFEVIYDMLPKIESGEHWAEMNMTGLIENLDTVIYSSLEERKRIPQIPMERRDYIVVAYLLIRFVINAVKPKRLYYCEYALKEGVIAEMIKG